MMCSGGGDSGRMMAGQSSLTRTTPTGLKRKRPLTLSERVDQLEEIIYWLKDLWLDPKVREEIDEKQLQEFIDKLWKEWETLVKKWSILNNDKIK